MRWGWLACGLVTVGCNQLLSLGDYRACEGAECEGGVADAATDVTTDVTISCANSLTCPLARPVCSSGKCVAVTSLSRGMSAFQCVVLSDTTARCWGHNDFAQMGSGTSSTASTTTPATVLDSTQSAPLTGVESIVTGLAYACALMKNGSVVCWGKDSVSAQPGANTIPLNASASQISGAAGVTAGQGSMCAVLGDGTAKCWGANTYGRIGCTSGDAGVGACGTFTPAVVSASNPVQLQATKAIHAIAVGTYATCAIFGSTTDYECWGNDLYGDLGNGTSSSADSCCNAVTVPASSSVFTAPLDAIEPTDFYTCAHTNAGDWYCWGLNTHSVMFKSTPDVNESTPVSLGKSFTAFSPGWRHACAISNTPPNVVECWGDNANGESGINVSGGGDQPPQAAHFLEGATDIASHRLFSCAINGDGQVYCWGSNEGWLLGATKHTGDVLEPLPVGWD